MVAAQFITDLRTIFNTESTITDITLETLTDAVIDELNSNGCKISNMSGAAGSKTITLTSAQQGAIRKVFRCIYASWHQNPTNIPSSTMGGISSSTADLMSNPAILAMIKDTARQLIGCSFKRA